MLKSFVALSAGLVGSAHAFWRMECPGRVGLARLDPIINPGALSKHVHAIHGSSGFSDTSGTAELLDGDCTSCRVTQDKSSYWHPAVYFQDADTGEFEIVEQVGGMLAYYLLYGDNVTAFPSDFRMISGTNSRRTYTAGDPSKPDPEKSLWASLDEVGQDTLAQRALGFNCLNYDRDPEGTLYRHYMPDKQYLDANCKDGLRFEIMFPSCWKGGDAVDSDNHKDHVAFPDLVMTGTCPEDYPVRLPSLMYEVIWNTAAFSDRNGQFVLANGDTTGYGYHADFIMGWDADFLQDAVNTCTNPSGRIEDCPMFDVVDEGTATSCDMPIPQALAKEDVKGPVKNLPGSVDAGDGSTGGGDGGSVPSTAGLVPTLTYAAGERPSDSAAPLPGQVFKETTIYEAPAPTSNTPSTSLSSTPTSSTPSSAAAIVTPSVSAAGVFLETSVAEAEIPTTTPAPELVTLSDSSSYFSTQYVTSGNLVSKILWEQQVVYVTELQDRTTTVTITQGAPAAPTALARRHRRYLHGHGHRRL
ncbi:Fc.00g048640.m01.CDS01 [Cosmosporella sp. VM-42]